MSIADQIAADHQISMSGSRCSCGQESAPSEYIDVWRVAHIATVTEAAVRAQIAEEIFNWRDIFTFDDPAVSPDELFIRAMDAATIARGEVAA